MEEKLSVQDESTRVEDDGDDDSSSSEISLRPMDLSDIDHFMTWATDDRVSRFCSWDTYTSKDDALAYLKTTVLPHPWLRAICLKGAPIGSVSVTPNAGDRWRTAELGYAVASEYWGRGIATTAAKMAACAVFREWPHLERLEALVDADNGGSARVLEKAGFLKEGVLRKYLVLKGRTRDMVLFSLLPTDPTP